MDLNFKNCGEINLDSEMCGEIVLDVEKKTESTNTLTTMEHNVGSRNYGEIKLNL